MRARSWKVTMSCLLPLLIKYSACYGVRIQYIYTLKNIHNIQFGSLSMQVCGI